MFIDDRYTVDICVNKVPLGYLEYNKLVLVLLRVLRHHLLYLLLSNEYMLHNTVHKPSDQEGGVWF